MEYHYSKQLILEIADQLDPVLIKFFERTKEKYNYPAQTVVELVNESMDSILKGKQSKDELTTVFKRVYNNRLKLRKAWYEKLVEDVNKIELHDPKYPLHHIVTAYEALEDEQWEALYGSGSLEEVIDSQVEAAKKWSRSGESYLTAFNMIQSKTPKKIYNALLSDVYIDLYDFLGEKYSGSIKNYFLSVPKEIAKLPIFGLDTGKLNLQEQDSEGNFVQDYEIGDKKSLRVTVMKAGLPVLAVGGRDKRIITECIKNLEPDFYRTRKIRVKRSDLVKIFSPDVRPSSETYDRMEKRCLNLTRYSYELYDKKLDKDVTSINLMDRVDVGDPEVITFTFGSFLYQGIINNELTDIKTATLQLLKDPMSELLCQMLCEERIVLATMGGAKNAGLVGVYSYTFFRSVVRLPARQKQNNLVRIKKSLQEYVENKVIVESFVMRGTETFEVHFYPLTEEEWADLEYNKKYREEVVSETLIGAVV